MKWLQSKRVTPKDFWVYCICSNFWRKKRKLDDGEEKCIFIGYNEESKAYKINNPLINKVVVTRDVIFNETKSTIGYVFYIGLTTFTRSSKKQSTVAFSTCEAKYMVSSSFVCESIWLRNLLKEFNYSRKEFTIIYVDNKSAFKLAKNPVQHGRSKHIDIEYHFLRDHVKEKIIKLEYYNIEEQVARHIYHIITTKCIQTK